MPSAFHARPSVRRDRSPVAKWLVLGIPTTTAVLHEGRTAHILPHTTWEHHKRYQPGQRLAVKAYIPGPTECHVILTSVQGPRETFYAGQVDDKLARELGHPDTETFRIAWVHEHDRAWWERADEKSAQRSVEPDEPNGANEILDEMALERFDSRWGGGKSKLAWLLRFRIDRAGAPRMLAAAPSIYDPGKEDAEGRDEDRGYTSVDSRALNDELPALTDDEWQRHVGPKSAHREWDRLREAKRARETQGMPERFAAARTAAHDRSINIRNEGRRYIYLTQRGKYEMARTQLALIESRVFAQAA